MNKSSFLISSVGLFQAARRPEVYSANLAGDNSCRSHLKKLLRRPSWKHIPPSSPRDLLQLNSPTFALKEGGRIKVRHVR